MFAPQSVLVLLAFASRLCLVAWALPQVEQSDYIDELKSRLIDQKLTTFEAAISEIGRTNDGASFLSSFYSDEEFTIYAPTDQAFEGYGLNTSNIQDENAFWLQDVFKYHVVKGKIHQPEIAPPRSHTILSTLYHNYTTTPDDATLDQTYGSLPGSMTQVLVLEQDPEGSGALIRGDGWNISTVGREIEWENLVIHQVNRIIPFPSPFLTTLSEPLISTTPSGLTIARSLINLFDAEQIFNGAMGITAFLPTDENVVDITKALANNRNCAAQQNLLFNHIVNGTVHYSSTSLPSTSLVTARGQKLEFYKNDTGTYIASDQVTAKILRMDVVTSNGVIHVIDRFLANPDSNNAAASSAYSSAVQLASTASSARPIQTSPALRQEGNARSTLREIKRNGYFVLATTIAVISAGYLLVFA